MRNRTGLTVILSPPKAMILMLPRVKIVLSPWKSLPLNILAISLQACHAPSPQALIKNVRRPNPSQLSSAVAAKMQP